MRRIMRSVRSAIETLWTIVSLIVAFALALYVGWNIWRSSGDLALAVALGAACGAVVGILRLSTRPRWGSWLFGGWGSGDSRNDSDQSDGGDGGSGGD